MLMLYRLIKYIAMHRNILRLLLTENTIRRNMIPMKQVRRIREDRGIKQYDLAKRIGVRPATLCALEKGKTKNPRIKMLRDIAAALEVPLESLLDITAA